MFYWYKVPSQVSFVVSGSFSPYTTILPVYVVTLQVIERRSPVLTVIFVSVSTLAIIGYPYDPGGFIIASLVPWIYFLRSWSVGGSSLPVSYLRTGCRPFPLPIILYRKDPRFVPSSVVPTTNCRCWSFPVPTSSSFDSCYWGYLSVLGN